MSCLQIVPIFSSFTRRIVTELAPTRDWFDLVDNEGQWMLAVAWLIVMDLTETTMTYPAWCTHCLETGAVLPAEVAIGGAWVISLVICHGIPPGANAMPPKKRDTPGYKKSDHARCVTALDGYIYNFRQSTFPTDR